MILEGAKETKWFDKSQSTQNKYFFISFLKEIEKNKMSTWITFLATFHLGSSSQIYDREKFILKLFSNMHPNKIGCMDFGKFAFLYLIDLGLILKWSWKLNLAI